MFRKLLDSGEDAGNKTVVTLDDAQKTAGVNFNKAIFKKMVKDRYNQHFRALNVYSDVERASFAGQLAEANAHKADNSASTPMLTAISTARSITVAALRDKVIAKAKKYLKQYSYREVANWLTTNTGRSISHVGLRKRVANERQRKDQARSIRKWAEYAEKAIQKAKTIEESRLGAKRVSTTENRI